MFRRDYDILRAGVWRIEIGAKPKRVLLPTAHQILWIFFYAFYNSFFINVKNNNLLRYDREAVILKI